MLYYEVVKQGDMSVSVDMIRLDFKLHSGEYFPTGYTYPNYFCNWLENQHWVETEVFTNFGWFKYKYLFKITCAVGITYTIGIGFNGCGNVEDDRKGFIEWNPNKVLHGWKHVSVSFDNVDEYTDDAPDSWMIFFRIFRKLQSLCVNMVVRRYDMAIDIPVIRSAVALHKDNRNYMLYKVSGEDYTEYLGKRSNGNYVKVYNKQIESNLDVPLTRVELTLELGSYADFQSVFPEVYISKVMGTNFEGLKETDIVLCELLMEKDIGDREQYLNRLGRYKKEKLKPFLMSGNGSTRLEITEETYDAILNIVKRWHTPMMAEVI